MEIIIGSKNNHFCTLSAEEAKLLSHQKKKKTHKIRHPKDHSAAKTDF
jgi:hypothetical protein